MAEKRINIVSGIEGRSLRLFVINLPGAVRRRQLMEAQLNQPGVPEHDFIPAVDGANLTPEALADCYDEAGALRDSRRRLKNGEIGCALSHRKAWQSIIEGGFDVGGVLEDDVALGAFSVAAMRDVLPFLASPRPRVVLLQYASRYSAWGGIRLSRLHRLYRFVRSRGAHAYLINAAAARVLCAATSRITVVADNWVYFSRWVDIRVVVPYCVGRSAASSDSQIGPAPGSEEGSKLYYWLRKRIYEKLFYPLIVRTLRRIHSQRETW